MAERVVLCTLDVDEQGAVRSIKAVEQQVGSLEKQTKGTADVFTHHMFNMRSAATAFLGAFTIGGGILAFKSFVTDIFEAQDNFKMFSTSLDKAKTSVFKMAGEILGLNQALADSASILDEIRKKTDEAKDKQGGGGWTGVIWQFLWGNTTFAQAESMLHTAAHLFGAPDFIGPPAPPGIGSESPYNPSGDAAAKAFAEQKDAVLQGAAGLSDYNQVLLFSGRLTKQQTQDLLDQADAFGTVDEAVQELTINEEALVQPSKWQKWKSAVKDAMVDFTKNMTSAQLAVDLMTTAANQFATSLGQALEGAGGGFKKIIADMLRGVGYMLLAWGALAVVKGWVTYDPSQIHAGIVAMAAGAGAIAASRLFAGGSAGGGADIGVGGFGGGTAALASIGGGGNTYNITNIIEGSSNIDLTARRLTIAVKRALADGAGGGSF